MKFKPFAMSAMLAALAFGAFAQSASAHGFDRGDRQERRIHHGVATGQLTHREAHHLMRQQHAIARAEAHARADGYVSWHEQRRIDRMRDHASRDIARQAHDRDVAWR